MSIVMLVGPIDYWWNEHWMTAEHRMYMSWRNSISQQLVEAGHLVYRPHEAFKGAWSEKAQRVNDEAIRAADILINLTPPGIPAYGTAAEITFASYIDRPILDAPPGDYTQIAHLLVPLADPYGDVHRKSYTKGGK
jgi:hypothetical protein